MIDWMLAAALALAPAAQDTTPTIAPVVVSAEMAPPPEDVLAIPADLREMLRKQVIEPSGNSRKRRLDLLLDFLFEEPGLGMQYQQDATHTVAESFRTRKANCLAFTLLTVALAREAGLPAYGQELERVLSWDMIGDIVMQNTHANASVAAGGERYVIDVAADELLTHSPPQRISDARLLALYYNNRAMELLILKRPIAAEAWLRAALKQDNDYATLWNNAGVLRMRMGDMQAAEERFLQALRLNPTHTGALVNVVSLYQNKRDTVQAAQWKQRADRVLRKDPFQQFSLGMRAEQRGDFASALKHYRRAIALDGDEHLFHFSMARAWLGLGDTRRAGIELARAHDLSHDGSRDRYQAKLDALKRMLHRE